MGILHHLLDENVSGHLFTLLGSDAAGSAPLAQQSNSDVASTESSASGILPLSCSRTVYVC